MTMQEKSTAIIGGGAIGLFSAYFLNRLGHRVTVVDTGPVPGLSACSSGNAGLIVPSHFIPLASPGVLKEGLKNLLKPSAPFGVSWSFNPELFGWLWQFYKSSLSRSLATRAGLLAELHLLSRDLYLEIQEDQNINMTLSLSGLLMVSEKEKTFQQDIRTAGQSISLGMPAEIWSAQKYSEQNSTLNPRVAGAVYYPWDGSIDPLPMLNHLKHWLKNNGVRFIENAKSVRWRIEGRQIRSIMTPDNEVIASHFLVSAGSQSSGILKELGLSIPLQPAKGYSYLFKNEHKSVSHPTLLQDAHVALTPYANHTRIAGNFLLGNNRSVVPQYRLDDIDSSVRKTYPGWKFPEPASNRSWSGNRPVSPDGLPMIGKSSVYKNLSVSTGHAMMGISLAPASGSIIADWINDNGNHSKFESLLCPSRFKNRF
jgi:D-amino-acid dehydrogenase